MIYKFFISYRRDTAEDFAVHLKRGLQREGISAFLDVADIPKKFDKKEKWSEIRDQAIRDSEIFLLIITEGIENSLEVRKEIALANEIENMDFMYFRHQDLTPDIVIEAKGKSLNLGDFNQIAFETREDLLRKVLRSAKADITKRKETGFRRFASKLNPEERREALIRISQFVLRDDLSKTREDLQKNIVEMGIFWADQATSKKKINEILIEKLNVIEFPEPYLSEILRTLLEENRVRTKNGKYRLTDWRRKEIEAESEENREVAEEVNQFVLAKVIEEAGVEKIAPQEEERILNGFYTFLARIFIDKAEMIARLLATGLTDGQMIDLPLKQLGKVRIKDRKMRDAARKAFKGILENPSETLAKFLFSISQNLICIRILNLDPLCQKLEREAFSDKVLFLDTNIIIALLCKADPLHGATTSMMDLTASLGVRVVASKRTIREYLRVLGESNKAYERLRAPDHILRSADDIFIRSFAAEKDGNPHLKWKGFHYSAKGVESFLKKRFDIQIHEDPHREILKKDLFEVVERQVSDCYESIRGKPKVKAVAQHDAVNLLLIRELRENEKSRFVGPNHWFLTADATLYCVDKLISELSEYGSNVPSSMLFNVWIQMVSPFLSMDLRERTLYDIFIQSLRSDFVTIPFEIPTNDLAWIQGDWLKYDWLEADHIERILNEEWVKTYLRKVNEAASEKDREKIDKLSADFANRLNKYLVKISDEQIKFFEQKAIESATRSDELYREQLDLRSQLGDLTSKVKDLETRLGVKEGQLDSERKTRGFLRTLSGLVGFLLIFSDLLFILLARAAWNTINTIYFGFSLTIGITLLILAVSQGKAREQISASNE